jgi:alkylation response protein AidB-like acyl-CoA dehydrogenase
VHFAFTEDQLAFRDAVRDLLERECPPAVVRAAWTNNTGRSATVWNHLADMGVLGVVAPETAGGLGLTVVDLVLVLEETGYAALPEPIVEHAAVAVPILEDPRAAAEGRVTVTAALDGSGLAGWADTADLVVLPGDTGARVMARNDVTLERRRSVDGARRRFAVTPTGDPTSVRPALGAFERGALGAAAQLVGLTRRMLDLTVGYVTERRQFGVPVGSFQAVKHHLADVRIGLEFARPLVYRAAWSLAHDDPDAALHVSMAKAQASDAAQLAGRQALQCHGATGYSYEYDLHLYLKRAWALAATWGDARWHRARVGRAILGASQQRSPDA